MWGLGVSGKRLAGIAATPAVLHTGAGYAIGNIANFCHVCDARRDITNVMPADLAGLVRLGYRGVRPLARLACAGRESRTRSVLVCFGGLDATREKRRDAFLWGYRMAEQSTLFPADPTPANWRTMRACQQIGHPDAEVVWQIAGNGAKHLAYWCRTCDGNVTYAKTKKSFLSVRDLPGDTATDKLPVVCVVERIVSCFLCHQPHRCEWHHIAPRELYGDDADRFPLVPLCATCHRWATDLTRAKIAVLRRGSV